MTRFQRNSNLHWCIFTT